MVVGVTIVRLLDVTKALKSFLDFPRASNTFYQVE